MTYVLHLRAKKASQVFLLQKQEEHDATLDLKPAYSRPPHTDKVSKKTWLLESVTKCL